MKEFQFIKNNTEKWKRYEKYLTPKGNVSPDRLANIYINLTDDLAFAQTYYPDSEILKYLNDLASKSHFNIYSNKPEQTKRFYRFWKYDVPLAVYNSRKEIISSFIFFAVAIIIGLFSTYLNDRFPNLIMGDQYVNLTNENIMKDDPLAIYKSMNQGAMFVSITTNNIMVSFYAYILGVFFSIGSIFLIIQNGIMVGAFIGLFIKKGLFWISFSTILLHGTLELTAIIIAGGAGIVLGNSFLFPGTYDRASSFKRGAKKSLKIVIGLIPIFIVAGFIESYLTRHYIEVGSFFRILVLLVSSIYLIWYFILYPKKIINYEESD